MDSKEKKTWVKDLIMAVITIFSTLIIFSMTIAREDKAATNTKLQKLDVEKADVIYVDEKCKEIRQMNTGQYNDLKTDIREMREVQIKMYEILSEKRK